jgi:hypothetical protein
LGIVKHKIGTLQALLVGLSSLHPHRIEVTVTIVNIFSESVRVSASLPPKEMEGEIEDTEPRMIPSLGLGANNASTSRQPVAGIASSAASGADPLTSPCSISSSTDLIPTAEDASCELPFLVTSYLARYHHRSDAACRPHFNLQQQQAVDRIRNAAGELASAFEALGAFGVSMRVRRCGG